MRLTRISLAIVLVVLLGTMSAEVDALGVQPLTMDLDMRPGDSEEFELLLTPGEEEMGVSLVLYQTTQMMTGGLTYEEAGETDFAAADWVELEDTRYTVPTDQIVPVRGTINVPFGAEGSHTVVIMIEPDYQATPGIGIRVRYAVRISINVERPGLRPQVQISDFELGPDGERSPELSAVVFNDSPLHFSVSAEVTLRDEGRRLVERVHLRPEVAWPTEQDSTRIHAGAQVRYYGPVQELLAPGEYEAQLFIRYADGMQSIERTQFTVEEDQFEYHEQLVLVGVEPEVIEASLRPGASTSQAIQISNRVSDDVWVRIEPRSIGSDYFRSVYQNLDVELRGEEEFDLGGRRQGRVVLVMSSDRDLEPGGYYGYLDVTVGTHGGDDEDTATIPVRLLIGDGWEPTADILGIEYSRDDHGYLFSSPVQNTSAAHIEPRGQMTIQDEDGEVLEVVPMTLREGVDILLPDRDGLMLTPTVELEPGNYTLQISILEGNNEIAQKTVEMELD